jgi:hypothetical protein
MKENLYRGPQFTFFPFYRKGLIGVWYCNLRNPVKATSLGHPRHTEARPEDWKGQVPSRKATTMINWVSSLLVSILTRNDLTNKARHPCLMTFPLPSMVRTGESDLVGLDHLTNAVRRGKNKTLGSCLFANSRQPL